MITSLSWSRLLAKVGDKVAKWLLLLLVEVTFVEAEAVEMCLHLAVILDAVDGGVGPGNERVGRTGNPGHQGDELDALAELGSVLNPHHLHQPGVDQPHPVANDHVSHGDVELVPGGGVHAAGGDIGGGEVADDVGVEALKELPVGLTCVSWEVNEVKKRILIDFMPVDLEDEVPDIPDVAGVVVELLPDEAERDVACDEVKKHLEVVSHFLGGPAETGGFLYLALVPGKRIPGSIGGEEYLELVVPTVEVFDLGPPLIQRIKGLDLVEGPGHGDLGHILLPWRVRCLRDIKGGVAPIVKVGVTVSLSHGGFVDVEVLDEALAVM